MDAVHSFRNLPQASCDAPNDTSGLVRNNPSFSCGGGELGHFSLNLTLLRLSSRTLLSLELNNEMPSQVQGNRIYPYVGVLRERDCYTEGTLRGNYG
jgi:hypothetical protein